MSPKSRGRRREQRRPSDRRRAQRRAAGDPVQTFVDQVLRESSHLLDATSPIDVESFVSSAIGVWWSNPAGAGLGTALVGRAHQLATPEAAALLHGLAALAEPGLSEAARAALDDLADTGLVRPPWADAVGRAAVRECFTVEDILGDASQVIMTFGYADEDAHAMVVLVDHNLGGLAKDIWIADDSPALLDQVRSSIADDSDL
ncbi:MAG TPA: hypothetical protein VE287_07440, partial [Actinopolymorphaceae bacterium]|nr:hypothetical protein [Actinopolymorphaceae bacterium]